MIKAFSEIDRVRRTARSEVSANNESACLDYLFVVHDYVCPALKLALSLLHLLMPHSARLSDEQGGERGEGGRESDKKNNRVDVKINRNLMSTGPRHFNSQVALRIRPIDIR